MTHQKESCVSRRNFLKRTCAGAVGLAFGSRVLGSMDFGGRSKEPVTLEDELLLQPEILFNSNRIDFRGNVFLMDANGDNQRALTGGDGWTYYGFDWFPDGKGGACVAKDKNKTHSICLVDVNGGQRILPNLPGENRFSPKVYPDGKNIGYLSGIGGVGDICRMDTNGNVLANLTQGIEGLKRAFALSPDGEKLAVIVEKRKEEEKIMITPGDILVMNAMDGSNRRTLVRGSADPSLIRWVGKHLYAMLGKAGRYDVFRIGPNDGERIPLSEGRGDGKYFTLSPDGERLYYTSNNQGKYDILGINSNGEGKRERLTDDEFSGGVNSVSPDGKYLAGFIIDRNLGLNQIFAMKIAQPWKRKVLTDLGSNNNPSWRPI